MTHKEHFERTNNAMPEMLKRAPEVVIENMVNRLIDALYVPVKGYNGITKTDPTRIKAFGIDDNEPINWGDLKCYEVIKQDGNYYQVTIDEAMPGECPTFCQYIEDYMHSYGWSVAVVTEW